MVILRVLDRTAIRGLGLSWDDYLIIVAVIAASVMNYVSIPMAQHGLGRDLWTLEFEDISMTFLLLYVIEIFYMFAEMCVQLSLLVFYLRVFPKSSRLVHVGSWILGGIVTCFGIANTLTMVFQCTPIPFFWNGWAGEMAGTCIDINLYSWIRAAIEIALDVAIMALPLPSLLALQLSRRKKLQTLGMFALGFVITIVSCLRLQSLVQFSRTQNPTLDNAPAVYWSVLECDIFIMCACLPSIRSIMVKVAPKVFGSTAGDSKNSGYKQGSSHTGSQQLSNLTKAGNIVKKTDVHIYREMSASDEELFPHSVSGQA
ncbi:hypothetical protein B0I35DRAFT_442359 [Stachybotrys elegans]|uniref:Rhodopsin domain-containing protein n=1 Tax=Stachybotrys elegans TaxID=80388 RepID=A0A8K0SFT9_9HYPO|nr:hypothetical protein B0I35DRAFT_442359 [Stachybotrys elegans]